MMMMMIVCYCKTGSGHGSTGHITLLLFPPSPFR